MSFGLNKFYNIYDRFGSTVKNNVPTNNQVKASCCININILIKVELITNGFERCRTDQLQNLLKRCIHI